ncbi:carbohydrate ABC transporter permease [Micrococcales bacterium 31B]|nr:carbohydrate ABC transporter permease [Micrococcales bacterium 31B]
MHGLGVKTSRAVVALVAVAVAVPLAYLISLSVRSNDDVLSGSLWPREFVWQNFSRVFETIPLARMLGNSWLLTALSVLVTFAVAVPAAYYTARAGRRGHHLGAWILASYCAPPIVAVLPLYFGLRSVGLLDTVWGLALVSGLANVPVAVWLLDSFVRRVPLDLEEAAALDGLGPLGTLHRIVIPLLSPGLVAVGLICAFLAYNEFLFAVSLTNTVASQPISVGLSLFQGDRTVQFGQQAAAALVAVAPMYVVAGVLQKYLVAGLTHGSVK